ncbi:MAG: NigD-like C-terminal domain-containing protein [Fermentimonas sp.]|jgi:hypothetical protein|nr:NigD-like C-terminal domain-containing protein [Fermentimonas sp.]NLC85819.1 hypothetical protein [Bacteroidales bacterium]HBT85543.1 hypothetical protein [Porphyromonadaceae bacterium]MDD2931187.1 NigD-like C-terminal domain-containing protein [Fermentimonas sp.]MDD3189208.1 NigD-like C-terminal domain-containing protein [Fermentimonas sp.]
MKNLSFIILIILFTAHFQSCDKEQERLDDFIAEFATVLKQGDSYQFELDNGSIITPVDVKNFSGKDGDRVIIYWTPVSGDLADIMRITPIFKGYIDNEGYPERYNKDPLKIISIWVEGDYLNLILEIEYHSKPHILSLFRDISTPETDLYLGHSINNDPPGYPQVMYASFLLSSLQGQNETDVPFRLFINSYNGMRQFNFTLINTR